LHCKKYVVQKDNVSFLAVFADIREKLYCFTQLHIMYFCMLIFLIYGHLMTSCFRNILIKN